jgi:hypothetical protein
VTLSDQGNYAHLYQKPTDEVVDIASKMQVMWVGSNHRYEFPLGGRIYKLKVNGDCEDLYRNLAFYLNSAKDFIPNYKTGDLIRFGIAVLPDGHELKNTLPELTEDLRIAALSEAREFLKVTHFQVTKSSSDVFLNYLKKNPAIFEKLLDGYKEREPFDKWIAQGMPKGSVKVQKPNIPFHLWDDSDTEMKDARLLYWAEQNCIKVQVDHFYEYLSKHYPLFSSSNYWNGVGREDVSQDLIEYFKFKLGIKPNEE